MKSTKLELYEIDKIIAKLSKAFDRDTIKYKEVLEQLLPRLDAKLKRYVKMISKKLTTTSNVPSRLTIEKPKESKKSKKVTESVKVNMLIKMLEKETGKKVSILSEGILDWVKGIYASLKDLFGSLQKERQMLQKLV